MVYGEFAWERLFSALDQWGLTDVLLPFLLVFTLIFSVLQKTKFLGEDSKKYNVIISFVMGFMFVTPHILNKPVLGYDPVDLVNSVLPTVSVLVIAVILFLILVGIFAAGEYQGAKGFYGIIVIVSLLLILYIFGAAASWWTGWSWLHQFLGDDTVAVLVMIVVFGLIIGFVVGDEKSDQKSGERFLDKFDKMFK